MITEINRKSDILLQYFLWGYFVFGLLLAFYYDTWLVAIGVGSLSLSAYFLTKYLLPQYTIHHYVGSAVLAIFMAQFIYQMHGMFEMHFFAFLGSVLLITYQNWRLQLPLFLFVVIHHAGFAYLQYTGTSDIYFTQLQHMSLQTFLFHAGLAGVIIGVCGLWGYTLRKRTDTMTENTRLLNKQIENVRNNIHFAESISRGELTATYQCQADDELGNALLHMRENLLQASQKEEQDRFINTGLTEINDLIRTHSDNIEQLSVQFTKQIVRYLKINQGGLFVMQGEEDNDPHLTLAGCYAYNRVKYLKKRVDMGEGLLGQLMLEKDTMYLTDIPQNYINITSGLGGANPRSILLVPLKTNDQMVGAIEVASFHEIPKYQITFLEKVAESLAVAIVSAKVNQRTKHLLDEVQAMNEGIRAQEEEMRQNLEELQATQEELERRITEYETMLREKDDVIQRLSAGTSVEA